MAGKPKISEMVNINGLWYWPDDICPNCDGDGCEIEGWECASCDGSGVRFGAHGFDEDDLDYMVRGGDWEDIPDGVG